MLDQQRKWTRRELLEAGTDSLSKAGIDEARRSAEWMLGDVLGCSTVMILAYPEREVPPPEVAAFLDMLARRRRHEPVQYILGYADFFGLKVRVTPDVLIPRPETEQVVEGVLECLEGLEAPRVLDVGTGSGCIALAIKHARPDARVAACDVSEAALAVAAANAEAHRLDILFTRADVLHSDFAQQVPSPFNLVVSNPPYIPDAEAATLAEEVRDFEPHLALFTGEDPCRFYRALAGQARRMLAESGRLVVETHAHISLDVHHLFEEAGFARVETQADLAGHPRMVSAGGWRD